MNACLRGALLAVLALGIGSAKAYAQTDLEQKVKVALCEVDVPCGTRTTPEFR